VVRALKELLTQLVGVRSYAIYMADDSRNELVVVSAEALAAEHLAAIPYGAGETQGDAQGMIEQAFVTGIARIDSGFVSGERSTPVACIPMRIDERAVGVIAIFSLLPQKEAFVPVDFELFRMLGPHAAAALVGAQLFSASAGIIPGVEVFQGMSPSLLPRPNVP
jgi:GAF domain-containing protein